MSCSPAQPPALRPSSQDTQTVDRTFGKGLITGSVDRPNILLVLTDQQTSQAISCAGTEGLHTPNMNRLAGEGVRFATAVCTSPVCGPARASLATGLMPHQHGLVFNHDERFADDENTRLPTFGDQLRAAGYGTWWIGKWHAQEFYPNRAARLHGFDFLPTALSGPDHLGLAADAPVTDRAISFLENAPTAPWFLGVSWHNPHDICYWIMGEHMEELAPVTSDGPWSDLPPNFAIAPDEPEFIKLCRERAEYGPEIRWTTGWSEDQWSAYLRAYWRLVEKIDGELGRLLDALDRTGLAENTLVIFTSDHGEGCAAHHLVVKLMPYDEAITVPLIARWPGHIPAGGVCSGHVASGLDLAPTICDFAGAPTPADGWLGSSLRPFAEAPETPGRKYAVVSVDPDPSRPDLTARVVRSDTHKYIAFSTGTPREALYDLRVDPGETQNVAMVPGQQQALSRHRNLLGEWLNRTADPFTMPSM